MSQVSEILRDLQAGERLTQLMALKRYGSMRLGARIHELRRKGVNVWSDLVSIKGGKRISEYWIPK